MKIFYGQQDAQGNILQDVRVCAFTGQKIEAGDEIRPIPGTGYFVRLKAGASRTMTQAAWEEIVAGVPSASSAKKKE